jgi:hypothetical protein
VFKACYSVYTLENLHHNRAPGSSGYKSLELIICLYNCAVNSLLDQVPFQTDIIHSYFH